MATQTLRQTLIATAVIGALAAGYARFGGPTAATPIPATASAPSGVAAAPAVPAPVTLPNFGVIVKESGPAVVNISVSGTRKVSDTAVTPL
ncbi:MAG: hypothetical protein ACXWT9_03435, partial [Methylomagnum sp.]